MGEKLVRIAHVLRWPGVGGTEIATLRLMQGLPGFAHSAFCVHHTSATSCLFTGHGFAVLPCEVAELSLRRPLPFLRSSINLARALRTSGVALLHCSDLLATCDAVLAGRLARVPVVAHIRNPHDKLLRRQRHLLRLVAYFIFVSEHARRHFDFDVPSGRASVVYDGLDIADDPLCGHVQTVRAELAVPDRAKLVGMIARLAPQKDHTTFLRAARRIVTALPKTRFVVVGDHSGDPGAARQFEALQQLTDELGIASSVTFTGFRSDVPRLLAAMDVVVLATHFEGFGLSLLEAMAHGRPVVATAVGGIPELVVDNETGLLHRPGDDEHLATQVLSLLCDEAGARRLAKAGRDRVGRSFTGATSCGGAEKVYRRLVKVS